MKNNREGYILPTIVLILALLLIIIPALIKFLQKDSTDAQSTNKKTTSFQLAEAGQDRGAWKLRESDAVWTNASTSGTTSGYNNDTIYTDVAGGQYKIKIEAGPGPGEVTVTSKGLATNTSDVRAIVGVYSKGTVAGAMSVVGGLLWRPNLYVEWGPVVEYGSITATPSTRYPRKYSAGGITGYDTDPNAPNGAMPSGNWAAYDYASYYSLGNAPTVKLNEYRTRAKACCVPPLDAVSGPGAAAHNMSTAGCHSGYYTENVNIDYGLTAGDYTLNCSSCVIFVEGEVKSFPNNAWLDVQALVATGDIDFNAKNTIYHATVPAQADKEYQYVPDGVNYWAAQGWATSGPASHVTISDVGMHGFLYTGGDLKNSGGNTILVGALFVAGNLTVNTTTIYYDSAIADNIVFETATITRTSWDEIRTIW